MFTVAWVVMLVIICTLGSWFSVRGNAELNPNPAKIWPVLLVANSIVLGILWATVARFTKGVLVASMMWDIVQTLVFVCAMSAFGAGRGFAWWQWLGVAVATGGFILMKIERGA